MRSDANAAWGVKIDDYDEAKTLDAKICEVGIVYTEVRRFPSGRADDGRALLYVDNSMRSTMSGYRTMDGSCFGISEPDPEWVAALAAVGLVGSWFVWVD